MNFDSKKWWEEKFLVWNESINSFVPMSRICLRHPIINRKDIIMRIHVCPNWQTNFNYKNNENWSFFYETKASMSFIPISRISLWCLNMKRKEIVMWIHACRNWHMNFDSRKWLKAKLFFWIESINVIYPNEENEFMVPNHEKKEIITWTHIYPIW